jgi:hypothetical protein
MVIIIIPLSSFFASARTKGPPLAADAPHRYTFILDAMDVKSRALAGFFWIYEKVIVFFFLSFGAFSSLAVLQQNHIKETNISVNLTFDKVLTVWYSIVSP